MTALGGPANGFPRETGFDITVASEVMACLCLCRDLADLQERLARIVVAETRPVSGDRRPVTVRDLAGRRRDGRRPARRGPAEPRPDASKARPAFVHGGPFANIAHGCNSVVATRAALALGDYAVTEAGFGADLGAEKFFDIKCRAAGLAPAAAVLVATVRAIKMNGGVAKADLAHRRRRGGRRAARSTSQRHIDNLRRFGVPGRRGDQPLWLATPVPSWPPSSAAARDRGVAKRSSAATGPRAVPGRSNWPRRLPSWPTAA